MELDAVAWRALQAGTAGGDAAGLLLGPELARFEAMAATTDESGRATRPTQAAATDDDFDEARDDARRRLVAVALGAGLVIILLLVTANDIARMALEGERRAARRASSAEAGGRPAGVTRDVLLTLSLLLGAALAARFIASLIRVPEILVLVAVRRPVRPLGARRRRRARSTRSAPSCCSRSASR